MLARRYFIILLRKIQQLIYLKNFDLSGTHARLLLDNVRDLGNIFRLQSVGKCRNDHTHRIAVHKHHAVAIPLGG